MTEYLITRENVMELIIGAARNALALARERETDILNPGVPHWSVPNESRPLRADKNGDPTSLIQILWEAGLTTAEIEAMDVGTDNLSKIGDAQLGNGMKLWPRYTDVEAILLAALAEKLPLHSVLAADVKREKILAKMRAEAADDALRNGMWEKLSAPLTSQELAVASMLSALPEISQWRICYALELFRDEMRTSIDELRYLPED